MKYKIAHSLKGGKGKKSIVKKHTRFKLLSHTLQTVSTILNIHVVHSEGAHETALKNEVSPGNKIHSLTQNPG